MKNKRYFIFAGDYYYPSGGMFDFVGSVDSLDEVDSILEDIEHDWMDILDLVTGEKVDRDQ